MRDESSPNLTLVSEALRKLAFFDFLPSESSACLRTLQQGTIERHATGEFVQREGEQSALIFLIEGQVRGVDGRHVRSENAFFGALELLLGRVAKQTLIANTPTLTYRLSEANLNRVIRDCPVLVRRLLVEFAHQLDRQASGLRRSDTTIDKEPPSDR